MVMDSQTSPSSRNLNMTSTGDQPGFSRRYACDRCRGHKLRCNRDVTSSMSTPCHRCSKANARCTISSNFRPGRPADGSTSTTAGQERLQATGADPQENLPSAGSSVAGYKETSQHTSSKTSRSNGRPASSSDPSSSSSELQTNFVQVSKNHRDNGENQSGSSQLFETPWDVMDLDFGGQQLRFGGPTSEGLSGSESILPPVADLGSNVSLSNYLITSPDSYYAFSNHSAPEPDKSVRSAVHVEMTGTAQEGPTTRPIAARQNSHPIFETFGTSVPNDISSISTPASVASPRSSNVAQQLHQNPQQLLQSPLTDQKEACIQKLSELSASLMKDLNRLITCKLASSFLFTPSDKATAGYVFQTLDKSMSQENAIGRVLHGTEQFLGILQELKHSVSSHPPTPRSEGGDDSPHSGVDDITGHVLTDDTKETRMESRWNALQSHFNSQGSILPTPPLSISASDAAVKTSGLDVQSSLVVLNCYTCLLKIFETVFYAIHHFLECNPSLVLALKLPHAVPGLQINGFMLNNRNLQIKILIQVSRHMLDSLEEAIGLNADYTDGSVGALGGPIFEALLQTLLKQEGLYYSEDNKSGMKKVREMLTEVEMSLK